MERNSQVPGLFGPAGNKGLYICEFAVALIHRFVEVLVETLQRSLTALYNVADARLMVGIEQFNDDPAPIGHNRFGNRGDVAFDFLALGSGMTNQRAREEASQHQATLGHEIIEDVGLNQPEDADAGAIQDGR